MLTYGGYISKDQRARVVATGLLPTWGLKHLVEDDVSIQPPDGDKRRDTTESAVGRNNKGLGCDKPMKRVDGCCILPQGHAGRCRSK